MSYSDTSLVITITIKDFTRSNNLPSSATEHIPEDPPVLCLFYMLPKVHKSNNPGRSIVLFCRFYMLPKTPTRHPRYATGWSISSLAKLANFALSSASFEADTADNSSAKYFVSAWAPCLVLASPIYIHGLLGRAWFSTRLLKGSLNLQLSLVQSKTLNSLLTSMVHSIHASIFHPCIH